MDREKLLVSFSGGETSAFMAQWLWTHKRDEYDMAFVFANTGQENERTLEFVRDCSVHFGFPVHWVEAKVYHGQRKGTGFSRVGFDTADRSGRVFEEVIKKYGIPNRMQPHCTRELKEAPIKTFAREHLGWTKYYTAIGIREDEFDRMSPSRKERRFVYPLIDKRFMPMTKPKINFWWSMQPFRLDLKGYQGNCKTCWKKSNHKLYTIAQETPGKFGFFDRMEQAYGNHTPASRLEKLKVAGTEPQLPYVFFRGNRSAQDILRESAGFTGLVVDDARHGEAFDDVDLLGGESCEVFAECGD